VAIPGFIIVLLLTLLLAVFAGYRRDIRRARERTLAASHVVQTSCGLIEYAAVGEGVPVLVAHGAGGGYDQSLDFADALVRDGFRVIAVSRFGYLRSPLPADASPGAQADAYAGLLDALHVQRVAVIGLSAGAPSAMQFALRYAQRTAALVLLVPAAYPPQVEMRSGGAAPKQVSGAAKILFDAALKSDFLFWAMPRLAPRAMMRSLVGTLPEVVAAAGNAERARAALVLDHLLPFSQRRLGLLNDAAIVSALPRYELERIGAPTLVVSAADDLFGTWEPARYSAEHIPGAMFVGYPSGGHLLIGHKDDSLAEIASLLRMHEDKPW
jgi:pimeloyl-ACP methyl ester carboxylesterase